jgi:hypothetical protein
MTISTCYTYMVMNVKCKCINCGNNFYMRPNGAHVVKFCTLECKTNYKRPVPKTKICNECGKRRKSKEYYKRKGGYLSYVCKKCQNKIGAKKNKLTGRPRISRIKYTLQKRELLRKFKDKPCVDCGKSFPYYCMDTDHRDGSNKLFTISNGVSGTVSIRRFKRELEKCDVRCAICHRLKTHVQLTTEIEIV